MTTGDCLILLQKARKLHKGLGGVCGCAVFVFPTELSN